MNNKSFINRVFGSTVTGQAINPKAEAEVQDALKYQDHISRTPKIDDTKPTGKFLRAQLQTRRLSDYHESEYLLTTYENKTVHTYTVRNTAYRRENFFSYF